MGEGFVGKAPGEGSTPKLTTLQQNKSYIIQSFTINYNKTYMLLDEILNV